MRIPRISIPVFVVACVLAASCSSSDTDTVEQLVDAHDLAWLDNDAAGVGTFYTDDGVFIDVAGGESVGREDIVRYAEFHVDLILESRRTGPVEVDEDGTFLYPTYLVVTNRGTYTGDVAVSIEDDLIARYDLTRLTRIEGP